MKKYLSVVAILAVFALGFACGLCENGQVNIAIGDGATAVGGASSSAGGAAVGHAEGGKGKTPTPEVKVEYFQAGH